MPNVRSYVTCGYMKIIDGTVCNADGADPCLKISSMVPLQFNNDN